MANIDTKNELLNAAEELFALQGYHTTSLRAITGKAKANLAAVNYHFGSKEALLRAVIERRLLPLNWLRRSRLEGVMADAAAADKRPETRRLLAAFVEPTLSFRSSGRGARAFIILISRGLGEPDPTVRSIFIHAIQPLFAYFAECLAVALPMLPAREIFWRVHFMVGSLAHIMHGLDKEQMFPREMIPQDPKELVEMLLTFLAAGMEATG
jgi:AcrR family transcriptional regulator